MGEAITLRVLTDAGLTLEDQAVSVVAPGELGYLGMLRNHAPLVTTLQSGKLIWRTPGGRSRTILVREGVLEIAKNRLTVLTSAITEPSGEVS